MLEAFGHLQPDGRPMMVGSACARAGALSALPLGVPPGRGPSVQKEEIHTKMWHGGFNIYYIFGSAQVRCIPLGSFFPAGGFAYCFL